MKRLVQITVAVLLVALVLAVFVSPAVDLPKTALRSQSVLLVVIGMIVAACRVLLLGGMNRTPGFFLDDTADHAPTSRFFARTPVLLC